MNRFKFDDGRQIHVNNGDHRKNQNLSLITVLDKCTQILRQDRIWLRKQIKNGNQDVINLMKNIKKPINMQHLQIKLRKFVNGFKNQQKIDQLMKFKENMNLKDSTQKRYAGNTSSSLSHKNKQVSNKNKICSTNSFVQRLRSKSQQKKSLPTTMKNSNQMIEQKQQIQQQQGSKTPKYNNFQQKNWKEQTNNWNTLFNNTLGYQSQKYPQTIQEQTERDSENVTSFRRNNSSQEKQQMKNWFQKALQNKSNNQLQYNMNKVYYQPSYNNFEHTLIQKPNLKNQKEQNQQSQEQEDSSDFNRQQNEVKINSNLNKNMNYKNLNEIKEKDWNINESFKNYNNNNNNNNIHEQHSNRTSILTSNYLIHDKISPKKECQTYFSSQILNKEYKYSNRNEQNEINNYDQQIFTPVELLNQCRNFLKYKQNNTSQKKIQNKPFIFTSSIEKNKNRKYNQNNNIIQHIQFQKNIFQPKIQKSQQNIIQIQKLQNNNNNQYPILVSNEKSKNNFDHSKTYFDTFANCNSQKMSTKLQKYNKNQILLEQNKNQINKQSCQIYQQENQSNQKNINFSCCEMIDCLNRVSNGRIFLTKVQIYDIIKSQYQNKIEYILLIDKVLKQLLHEQNCNEICLSKIGCTLQSYYRQNNNNNPFDQSTIVRDIYSLLDIQHKGFITNYDINDFLTQLEQAQVDNLQIITMVLQQLFTMCDFNNQNKIYFWNIFIIRNSQLFQQVCQLLGQFQFQIQT